MKKEAPGWSDPDQQARDIAFRLSQLRDQGNFSGSPANDFEFGAGMVSSGQGDKCLRVLNELPQIGGQQEVDIVSDDD